MFLTHDIIKLISDDMSIDDKVKKLLEISNRIHKPLVPKDESSPNKSAIILSPHNEEPKKKVIKEVQKTFANIHEYCNEEFGQQIQNIETQYEEGSVTSPKLIESFFEKTMMYLLTDAFYSNSEEKLYNALKFRDVSGKLLHKSFGSDLEQYYQGQRISALTLALVLRCNGENVNAVHRLVSKLTKIPEATIRKYHLNKSDKEFWLSSSAQCTDHIGYIRMNFASLLYLSGKYDFHSVKSGTNKYDKEAYQALQELIIDLEKCKKSKPR